MSTIRLTDQLGLDANIPPEERSAFGKYFKALPELLVEGKPINDIAVLTLENPAITAFETGLNFKQPVDIGAGDVQLSIRAGASGSMGIFVPNPKMPAGQSDSLFADDDFGEDIPVSPDERYVSVGFTATVGPSVEIGASDLSFGFDAASSVSIVNYRKFSISQHPPTVLDAVKTAVAEFQLPGDIEDLEAMERDSIVAVSGRGSLKFSATANLLAAVNPLATANLVGSLPAIQVKAGESISVGASFELFGDHQIRVRKIGPTAVRLGFFRERGTEFTISAETAAGVSAGIGAVDLFPRVIAAISPRAEIDLDELAAAKIAPATASAMEATVTAAIERSLEIALSFELGSLGSKSAAFLYEIDLALLDERGRAAIHKALDGDLTLLIGEDSSLPAGVTVKKSIFTRLRESKHTLKINLLGIYNFISVSKLALEGQMLVDAETGELTLTDTATAARIQAGVLNVGGKPNHSDPKQLRNALASSFLITATYRAANCILTPPNLKSSHVYAELHARTNRETMQDELDAAVGLGLMTAAEQAALVGDLGDFGRTVVSARAEYDDALTTALFLDGDAPRPMSDYESIGREAMQIAIHDDATDSFRLQPLASDELWNRMRQAGQTAFPQIFPRLSAAQIGAITADYTTIAWWAGAMRVTAEKLAAMRQFFAGNPGVDRENNSFKQLRADLASHLKTVAADTKEEFGRPWGLIAMDMLSGNRSDASVVYTGPVVALARRRQMAAAGMSG